MVLSDSMQYAVKDRGDRQMDMYNVEVGESLTMDGSHGIHRAPAAVTYIISRSSGTRVFVQVRWVELGPVLHTSRHYPGSAAAPGFGSKII